MMGPRFSGRLACWACAVVLVSLGSLRAGEDARNEDPNVILRKAIQTMDEYNKGVVYLPVARGVPLGNTLRDAFLDPDPQLRSMAQCQLERTGFEGVVRPKGDELQKEVNVWLAFCTADSPDAPQARRFLARMLGSSREPKAVTERWANLVAQVRQALIACPKEFSNLPANAALVALAKAKGDTAPLEALLKTSNAAVMELAFYFSTTVPPIQAQSKLLWSYLLGQRDAQLWKLGLQTLDAMPEEIALAAAADSALPPGARIAAVRQLGLASNPKNLSVLLALTKEKGAHPALTYQASVAVRNLTPAPLQTGEVKVSDVTAWPGYEQIQIPDPRAARPVVSPAAKGALRARLEKALQKYIGAISKVEELLARPSDQGRWLVVLPQWENLAQWQVTGQMGIANVWAGAQGTLWAEIVTEEMRTEKGQALIDWMRGLLEDLWGGKLEDLPDYGTEGHSYYWRSKPGTANDPSTTIVIGLQQNLETIGMDKATGKVQYRSREKTRLLLACGLSAEDYAHAAATKPPKMQEREAVARMAWAVQKENLKTPTGKALKDHEDLRVVQVSWSPGNTWSMYIAAKWRNTTEPNNPNLLREGLQVFLVTLNPQEDRVTQDGSFIARTEEEYRTSGQWNRTMTLKELEAWPEFALVAKQIDQKRQADADRAAQLKAAYDKIWPAAKTECVRIMQSLRPDQLALADQLYPLAGSASQPKTGVSRNLRLEELANLGEWVLNWTNNPEQQLWVVAGKNGSVPELWFGFKVEEGRARLRGVRLHLPPTGKEPAFEDAAAWEALALDGFQKAFGEKPIGRLQKKTAVEQSSREGGPQPPEEDAGKRGKVDALSFTWLSEWDGKPLPNDFASGFHATKTKEGLELQWIQEYTQPMVEKTVKSLSSPARNFGDRHATMAAVKAAAVYAPDAKMELAVVKSVELRVENTKQFEYHSKWAIYCNEPELKRLAEQAPLTPLWSVTIDLNQPNRRSIHAWMDPVSGTIIRFDCTAPPIECR